MGAQGAHCTTWKRFQFVCRRGEIRVEEGAGGLDRVGEVEEGGTEGLPTRLR